MISRRDKHIKRLTESVLLYLAAVDELLRTNKEIPVALGKHLAQWHNALEMENDSVRFNNGVDFRTDSKPREVKRITKQRAKAKS
ncbi:MAG: hypothetical protein JWM95_1724 [Gemmatimonadetes bacterium]|nr:hypothetical protein [Gemmatimonadota bacterium]